MNGNEPANETEQQPPQADADSLRPSKRTSLTRSLPTDRVTFTSQLEILRAYPAAYEKSGTAVSLDDLKGFINMAPATISLTNSFFCNVGLLRKDGRKFVPCGELQATLRMWSISQERAWRKLGPVFQRSWIGEALIPKLRFKPLSEEDAAHELAEAATAEAQHLPQIRMVIDYLLISGLVVREGGMLRLANGCADAEGGPATPAAASPSVPEGVASPTAKGREAPVATLLLDPAGERRFIVQAPPTISSKELDRIKRWLEFQLIIEDPPEVPRT